MNLNKYQEISKRTINKKLSHRDLLANMTMGISGEFGEAIDVVKKHLYQGHPKNEHKVVEEIGDGMWYVANLCNLYGLDLEKVLEENYLKLKERYPKGFSEEDSINRNDVK